MPELTPTTDQLLDVVAGVVLPLMAVERTMVLPHDKSRHEDVAQHSFMLGAVACALADQLDDSLDMGRIAQYALVHDVPEVHVGDITVWATQAELARKKQAEAESTRKIAASHPAFPWITRMIEQYERLEDPESKFVYAVDKMLSHMMVVIGDYHPVRPTREAYERSEVVARKKISLCPILLPYFDDLCQRFHNSPHFFNG